MKHSISRAAERWHLSNIQIIYQNSNKAVCSATSEQYGDVILKCDRSPQLFSEYRMLKRLDGETACRVYDFEEENGWLLEERILPGNVLREEPSPERRIEAFGKVFRSVHRPAADGETYLDWLRSVHAFCKNEPTETGLADMADEAYRICAEMFRKYPERVLLHGDLHHDNLLLREDGTYTMIDPKGVAGPEILDIPRFLLNELDTVHDGTDAEHIGKMIVRLSEVLDYPEEDLRKLFFMETVLENAWSYEDGDPVDREELRLAQKIKKLSKKQTF